MGGGVASLLNNLTKEESSMNTVEIILSVVLGVVLIHHIWWGIRAKKAINQHRDAIMFAHKDDGIPSNGNWPPVGLTFP